MILSPMENKMLQAEEKWYILELPVHNDDSRGILCVLEYDKHCELREPKRTFWVTGVPNGVKRGGHAHRKSQQFHFCLNGTAKIEVDDGRTKDTIILDKPNIGLVVEPFVWAEFELSSPAASLVVITSENYDSKEYIRDYKEFKLLVKRRGE